MHRLVAAVLVALYLLLVAHLTLTDPSNGQWAFSLADRVAVRLSDGALTWDETEVLANIALFVPLGFLLTVAVGSAWAAVTLCTLLSAGIEWVQLTLLPSRVPTVDDVVHNALGGLVGAALAVVLLALVGGATGSRRRAAVSARG